MILTDFLNRTFSLEKARKAKNCRLCEASWAENDDIYIMRNPTNSSFELVCTDCGNKIKEAKLLESNSNNKVNQDTIDKIIEDLHTIINRLKELSKCK